MPGWCPHHPAQTSQPFNFVISQQTSCPRLFPAATPVSSRPTLLAAHGPVASSSAAAARTLSRSCLRASPYFTTDTVTQEAFQEAEYESTDQASRRKAWKAAVNAATGRKHHLVWAPELDPPLLLDSVAVVLVGPKKPVSCGTIARACSCFEVEDLRIVQPRCQPNTRYDRHAVRACPLLPVALADTADLCLICCPNFPAPCLPPTPPL